MQTDPDHLTRTRHIMETMSTDERSRPDATEAGKGSGLFRKTWIAVVGIIVILIGIPLIPLIGPGWLIVFTGLAILATEFAWADRLRNRIRAKMRSLLGTDIPGDSD